MVSHLAQVLRRLSSDLASWLDRDAIVAACREANHHWRDRVLDPVTTLHLFALQILYGNTACNHVPRLAGLDVSGSAYCQARGRLPLAVLRTLLDRLSRHVRAKTDAEERWKGHRTFLVDGSSFTTPDTPELQEHFGQSPHQKPGLGFPTAQLLALFHMGTGLLIDIAASPFATNDLSQTPDMHLRMRENDLLVGDRGFCSFAHFALLLSRKMHGLFRVSSKRHICFRPGRASATGGSTRKTGKPRSQWIRRLGFQDQLVEWFRPRVKPTWMSAAAFERLPERIQVRELRYTVAVAGFRVHTITLATTLLDPELYPKEAIAELYRVRWQIETNFRHLKQTMKLDALRSKTVEGVWKELTGIALIYNAVRLVILEAAHRQGVAPERISFIDAVRWLCHARPGQPLGPLVINPDRPGRNAPRVVKRRPKHYPKMCRPRAQLIAQQSLAA